MIILILFFKRIIFVTIILIFSWLECVARDTGTAVNQLRHDSISFNQTAKQRLDELTGKSEKVQDGTPGEKDVQNETGFSDPMLPESPNPLFADSLSNVKYQAALQEYYDYHISGLQHRSKVFRWQLFSSKIIFIVVIILVFAGIYFAAVQFYIGLKQVNEKLPEYNDRTEITASMNGIKVSSPVLGVIILVISLAFFYLYLVHVFPIEDIF